MGNEQLGAESNREKILRMLWEFDTTEPVTSTRIRRAVSCSNQLFNHHIKRLTADGLVEQVGTEDVGAPQPARTYRLTEDGEERGEALSERHEERVREHAQAEVMDRITSLERRLTQLESKQERDIGRIEERFEKLKDILRPLQPLIEEKREEQNAR